MIILRLLHVVLGATWVGMAVFLGFYLAPAIRESGPAGGAVMGSLAKRGITTIMPILALITLISGTWLYSKTSGGFEPQYMRTRPAMAIGTGGLIGILTFFFGMLFTRPAMMKAMAIMQRVGPGATDAERQAAMSEAARYRARGEAGGKIVAVGLLAAVAFMAVARYL